MALENWIVIYNQKHSGAGMQIPFKNQTEALGGRVSTETAMVATVEAGSEQEAATAVRKAFGNSVITQAVKCAKSSNVKAVNA